MSGAKHKSDVILTKHTPYLDLMGQLGGVYLIPDKVDSVIIPPRYIMILHYIICVHYMIFSALLPTVKYTAASQSTHIVTLGHWTVGRGYQFLLGYR